jgi:hypothetical protein
VNLVSLVRSRRSEYFRSWNIVKIWVDLHNIPYLRLSVLTFYLRRFRSLIWVGINRQFVVGLFIDLLYLSEDISSLHYIVNRFRVKLLTLRPISTTILRIFFVITFVVAFRQTEQFQISWQSDGAKHVYIVFKLSLLLLRVFQFILIMLSNKHRHVQYLFAWRSFFRVYLKKTCKNRAKVWTVMSRDLRINSLHYSVVKTLHILGSEWGIESY